MSLQAALYDELKNNAGVSAIVSTRIYPGVADDDASTPYITFTRISAERLHHMMATSGRARTTIQINSWDDNAKGAHELSDAIREGLDHFDGTLGSAQTATVQLAKLENERDQYEAPIDGSEVGVHSVQQDWAFWHSETIPTFS